METAESKNKRKFRENLRLEKEEIAPLGTRKGERELDHFHSYKLNKLTQNYKKIKQFPKQQQTKHTNSQEILKKRETRKIIMKNGKILMATAALTTMTAAATGAEIQGYLQIRLSMQGGRYAGAGKNLEICAKNFEHFPRAQTCTYASEHELVAIPEIGIMGKAKISLKSRQRDLPFRFTWPVRIEI